MPYAFRRPESFDSDSRRVLASKSGKSVLSVTAPAPRLYFDVESASRFLPIQRVHWDPTDGSPPPEPDGTWDTCVVPTRDWATIEAGYKWLAHGGHPFRSVIIDSISELQTRYLEGKYGRAQLQQQGWGDVYRTVQGLVSDLRDLTMHPTRPLECLVMTAMTKKVNNQWRPWCQGQLQDALPYKLDAVVYLYIEHEWSETEGSKEVRKILTRPTDEYVAGERVGGKWPVVISEPNIDNMIDLIFGPVPTPNTEETVP